MKPQYIKLLYSLGKFGIKLGLENIQKILMLLNNPQNHPRIIHIAGTNGKGSTLITLERLLLAAGYSVGSTVSPHLIEVNERFRLNGNPINDQILENLFLKVCKVCQINPEQPDSYDQWLLQPTFFEFTIAMAFLLFAEQKVDYVILETGLGGRLDATNVILNPLICIITKIGFDHEQQLGSTLQAITNEKLAIIKPSCTVFVAKQEQQVQEQIINYCQQQQVSYYFNPKDFGFSQIHQCPELFFQKERLSIPQLGLSGEYQWENTATALAAFLFLRTKNFSSSNDIKLFDIPKELTKIRWPGRMQFLDSEHKILLDGAHNQSGMEVLYDYLYHNFRYAKILVGITWMKNKNLANCLSEFKNLNMVFQPLLLQNHHRAEESANIYHFLIKENLISQTPITVEKFIDDLSVYKLNFDLILITGSLYLIGEFLTLNKN